MGTGIGIAQEDLLILRRCEITLTPSAHHMKVLMPDEHPISVAYSIGRN
jgi:hypothetical protein